MKILLRTVAVCVALMSSAPAWAVLPDEILNDPALESRARNLSKELRCMVCQNQSIDDSDAPLARDLRLLVRERLKSGDSDKQVIDFLTARYGDFVLLNPRLSGETFLLWSLPALVLLGGAFGMVLFMRRQRASDSDAGAVESTVSLTADEQKRIEKLLDRQGG